MAQEYENVVSHAGQYYVESIKQVPDVRFQVNHTKASADQQHTAFQTGTDLLHEQYPFACKKCDTPNMITQFGYFCVDCMNDMGIGTEHNDYKHGYV